MTKDTLKDAVIMIYYYDIFGFTVEGEVEMRTLYILPFDSNRKRMSVIVEHPVTHEIILYCKGADSAIFTNLKPKSPGKTTSLCYFVQVCWDGIYQKKYGTYFVQHLVVNISLIYLHRRRS